MLVDFSVRNYENTQQTPFYDCTSLELTVSSKS